jgi:hypothetical protein
MGFQLNYQANAQDVMMGFEAWPEAWYTFRIVKTEFKPTKDATPQQPAGYLQLDCMCIDQQSSKSGQIYPWRLNIQNANQDTVANAFRAINALSCVTNMYDVRDTDNFLGREFRGRLTYSVDKNVMGPDGKPKVTGNNCNQVTDLAGRDPKTAAAGGPAPQSGPGGANFQTGGTPVPGQAPPPMAPQQQPQQQQYGTTAPPQQQPPNYGHPPSQQPPPSNYGPNGGQMQPPPLQQPPQQQYQQPPQQQQPAPQQQYAPAPQGGPPPMVGGQQPPQQQQQQPQPGPGYSPAPVPGWGPR